MMYHDKKKSWNMIGGMDLHSNRVHAHGVQQTVGEVTDTVH
jgi:hypothetical protein